MAEGRLVAVVDDDESVRWSVKNLLGSTGIDVEVFPSAEAFFESPLLEVTSCLILDLRLEGMSGLELMAKLQSRRAIPVVMLTGHGDEEVQRRALAAGAASFLSKPFRPDDLLDAVNAALPRIDTIVQ